MNIFRYVKKTFHSFWSIIGLLVTIVGFPFALAYPIKELLNFSYITSLVYTIIIFFVFCILIALILSIISYLNLEKQIETFNIDSYKTPENLFHMESHFFGASYILQNLIININENGSSDKKCNFIFKSETESIRTLEFYSRTPSLSSNTKTEKRDCHILQANNRPYGAPKIKIKEISLNHKDCKWALYFIPPLNKGQQVSYNYAQSSPKNTFAISAKDLQKKNLEFDFYSHNILYPTKKLVIEIMFSLNLDPLDLEYDVWIEGGKVTHIEEDQRIKNNNFFTFWTDEEMIIHAKLDIDYPLHGLKYIIKWIPANKS